MSTNKDLPMPGQLFIETDYSSYLPLKTRPPIPNFSGLVIMAPRDATMPTYVFTAILVARCLILMPKSRNEIIEIMRSLEAVKTELEFIWELGSITQSTHARQARTAWIELDDDQRAVALSIIEPWIVEDPNPITLINTECRDTWHTD